MKILMLLNAPYPDDIRVRKEATALIKSGFEVHLLCRKVKNELLEENIDGIVVHRMRAGISNLELAARDILISTTGKHPEFYNNGIKLLKKHSYNAIHVHDLPLGKTALALKREFPSINVILDLHENYPEGLLVWHQWKKGFLVSLKNKLFMGYKRWFEIERESCEQADKIIAVVDEMKYKLIENHSIQPDKICVVTNTEDKTFVQQPDNPQIYDSYNDQKIIAYCGGIGPHRGVDTAIKAMSFLRDLPVRFVITGFGSQSVMQYLKSLIIELNLSDKVIMLGKKPFSEFYSRMKYADIHIIPHSKNGHTDHTVPHKLFQGMMTGTPLLVSNVKPLKRIVEEVNCGEVFQADNPTDCAEKIRKLLSSNTDLMSKNAIDNSLNGVLNWENTSKNLIKLYQNLDNIG